LFPSYSKEECRIAEYFAKWQGTLRQIKDMGASDCSCNSHLFYFGEATIAEIEEHVDKFGENYQLIK
jgi:Uri superfamily endonuclease